MPATLRWLMDGSATEPLSAPVARDTGGTAESDCLAGDDSFEESLAVAMRGGLPDRETEARAAAEVRVSCAAHEATESIKLSQPSRYQDIRLTGNQGGSATEPLSAPVARVTGGTAESDCLAGDDSFEEDHATLVRVFSDPAAQSGFAKVLFFMFFDMGLEGIGGPDWLSRVFRGPSRGLVIKTERTQGP